METSWSIYSKYGIISAKDLHNYNYNHVALRSKLQSDAPVEFHEEIAVIGYVEYFLAFGHFPMEILPRLIFLDKFLDKNIPIVWPSSKLSNSYRELFEEFGVLSKTRKRIFVDKDKVKKTIVAKKLYFVTTSSTERVGEPLNLWILHRYINYVWQTNIKKDLVSKKLDHLISKQKKIVILNRPKGSTRHIINHNELFTRLSNMYDSGINNKSNAYSNYDMPNYNFNRIVYEFEITSELTLLDVGKFLYNSVVFIAPHGAGLNNMLMLPTNSTVIEIGYIDRNGFRWPPSFLCQARSLGHNYFPSAALEGNHYSDLIANIDEIVDIVSSSYNR